MSYVTKVTCKLCGRIFPTTDHTAEPDVCWMCERDTDPEGYASRRAARKREQRKVRAS